MAVFKLNDALGLSLDGKLADNARLFGLLPSFARLAEVPLDRVPLADATAKLKFTSPIPVPAGNLDFLVGASGGGTVSVIGPGRHAIDEDDPFNEIEIGPTEFYLALSLGFSLNTDLSRQAGPATFGFFAEREFEIRCYRRFESARNGFPSFAKAFAATASSFLLPRQASDVNDLPPGTVVVLLGTGTLEFSAGVSVSLPTETLAAVSAGGPFKFQARAGAQAGVDARVTLTGGYQVRLRRLDASKTELGVYTIKSRESELAVSASAGITASAGQFDLGERVIRALSPQPAVDVAEFTQALPGEDDQAKARRIEGFESSIGAAISTKLQASLRAAFSRMRSHEAAWLFEIDSQSFASGATEQAVTSALHGKFGDLTRDPAALPPGIAQTMNLLTDTNLRKVSLKINLLGLVNFMSVGKALQVTELERNAAGDVTLIVDSSSASRLQALLVTFGKDKKRLRKLLSENFLIEAAYRAKDLGVLSPEFRARHTYFEIHDSTSRAEMKNNLDVARLFGLLKLGEVHDLLANRDSFGRTTFYAETRYTANAVRDAFLHPLGGATSAGEYEAAGRNALRALLMDDTGQEFRKRVAEDDNLWSALKRTGNRASFAPLFGLPAGTVDPRVEAAGADYTAITNWAEAMVAASNAIRELDDFLGSGPIPFDDPRLKEGREKLNRRLSDVVKNTKEEFGDPLGMAMFYLAAAQNAERIIVLEGAQMMRLERSSAPQLRAHA